MILNCRVKSFVITIFTQGKFLLNNAINDLALRKVRTTKSISAYETIVGQEFLYSYSHTFVYEDLFMA